MRIAKMFVLALFICSMAAGLAWAGEETRLMRFPDIHQGTIVFVYADDLWTVSSEGGVAQKLTSPIGSEFCPKFSPDGTRIAFTGNYDENADVYVIPAGGGEPVRLTYHPGIDRVVDWYPDGKEIFFLSGRESYSYRFNRLFKVSAEGGFPEALPLHESGQASFSPDAKRIAYNRMDIDFRTWKRYKGGMASDVWIYDFPGNTVERITDYDGSDSFPMWYQEKIYFISDRDHAMNIFCYDMRTKQTRKITDHSEYDVKWPSLGGDAIVYENGGYLYVLDLKTEKTRKLRIEVPSDKAFARAEFRNVSNLISSGDLSPSGSRAVFNARGELFTIPAKKGDARNITDTPEIREIYPAWSPDGKWVAYLSDRTGEYELYMKPQDGKGEEVQLTKGSSSYMFQPAWSPDSTKILISDKTQTLSYIDIDKKKLTKIDSSDIFEIHGYSWSPDSKWVTYPKTGDNYFSSIYIYSFDQDKVFRVTSGYNDDYEPVFDPEGKYLYFISARTFTPIFNTFESNVSYNEALNICVATLKSDLPSPFEPESDEEKGIEKKDEEKGKDAEKGKDEKAKDERAADVKEGEKKKEKEKEKEKDAGDGEKKEKPVEVKIDLEGIENRVVSFPVGAGNYTSLAAIKGKVFYISYPTMPVRFDDEDEQPAGTLQMFDMKERESKVVIQGIDGYTISYSGEKILYKSKNIYGIIEVKPDQKSGDGKINSEGLEMRVDPKKEWDQMFMEAWRLERDFFYDPNLHGVDWTAVRDRYRQLIPHVANRSDLNYILGEMIAELSCSHTYVGGGDIPYPRQVNVGLLGADLVPDKKSGFYQFKKIFKGHNWDKDYRAPLTEPGSTVKEGDYLIAVNGHAVKYPANPYYYFENTAEKLTVIKVNSKPDEKDAREVTVKPVASDLNLRYLDWVETNRQKVDKATDGKVGYIHVPDTGIGGLNEFMKAYYPQVRKEGLIIDVRYNSGGMIPDFFIERLRREVVSLWARRHGKDYITPSTALHGHMVCIINHYAGSGGDAFPYYFRQYGLGPLIGTRTWGGLVGISRGLPLMDGGAVTMPEFAMWSLEGQWEVENYGVAPDIEIDNTPDLVVAGHDPQLEKAIEVVMDKIKKEPKKFPPRPAYPIKK